MRAALRGVADKEVNQGHFPDALHWENGRDDIYWGLDKNASAMSEVIPARTVT